MVREMGQVTPEPVGKVNSRANRKKDSGTTVRQVAQLRHKEPGPDRDASKSRRQRTVSQVGRRQGEGRKQITGRKVDTIRPGRQKVNALPTQPPESPPVVDGTGSEEEFLSIVRKDKVLRAVFGIVEDQIPQPANESEDQSAAGNSETSQPSIDSGGARDKPRNRRTRRRATAAATAGAIVLTGAAACSSQEPGPSPSTSHPRPVATATPFPVNGAIDVRDIMRRFGDLPEAVRREEGDIVSVRHYTAKPLGNGSLINYTSGGTGSLVSVDGQVLVQTAGHVLVGEGIGEGNGANQTCNNLELDIAPDGKIPPSMVFAAQAYTQFDPLLHNGSSQPDVALIKPNHPEHRPTIPLAPAPPVPGTRVYFLSLQPNDTSELLIDPFKQKPDIIGGVVIGRYPEDPSKLVILTSIKDFQGLYSEVDPGASGGPVMTADGRQFGNIEAGSPVIPLKIPGMLQTLQKMYGIKGFKNASQVEAVSFAIVSLTDQQTLSGLAQGLSTSSCRAQQ